MRTWIVLLLALALAAPPARAQTPAHTAAFALVRAQRVPALTFAAAQRAGADAFLVETAGGMAGSLAGVLIGSAALSGSCEAEDLVCNLQRAGVVVLIGTAGAVTGAYAAGRWQRTDPSLLGGVLGAVVGAGAGIGVIHLLKEDLDVTTSDVALLVSFSITQGITTALGSRLLSR